MKKSVQMIFWLACAASIGAGEVVYAGAGCSAAGLTPSAAALKAMAAGEPLTEAQAVFPSPVSPEAGLSVLSATASIRLAWMMEGERRRYFRDQEPDSVLAEVTSQVRLAGGKSNSNASFQLPEPEAGRYWGLSVSASLEDGAFETLAARREPGSVQFLLAQAPGRTRDLKIRYFTFLHRQVNPLLRPGKSPKKAMAARAGLWGQARRGAGKAGYFSSWLIQPLARLNPDPKGTFSLDIDLGRRVPSRWIQMEPLPVKVLKCQWIHFSGFLKDAPEVKADISDAVLIHYPPMNLKLKQDSADLVEEAARECGRR